MSALGQRLYESGVKTRPVSKYLGSNTNSTAPRDNADTFGTNRYHDPERIWIEHTMKYYLVAYPNVSAQDRAWIESYRRRYDLLYRDVIEPHFTLVFGGVMLSEATIASEAERLLDGVKSIQFELALATINRDSFHPVFHEFLVPEKGYAAITLLHDRLYSGAFRSFLRLDIGYIPHIGVGNNQSAELIKGRVDALNQRGLSIAGTIEAIDMIGLHENRVSALRQFRLS